MEYSSILWLAFFGNQHTKSIEKYELCRLIAQKQVKIDVSCQNKKFLNLGDFSEMSIIKAKIFQFPGLFTNSKQRNNNSTQFSENFRLLANFFYQMTGYP